MGQGQTKLFRQVGLYWRETSEINGLANGFILSIVAYLVDKPSVH